MSSPRPVKTSKVKQVVARYECTFAIFYFALIYSNSPADTVNWIIDILRHLSRRIILDRLFRVEIPCHAGAEGKD